MADHITILTAVNQDGSPSQKRMTKFFYSDGTVDSDAKQLYFAVQSCELGGLRDFYSIMGELTMGAHDLIIRDVYSGASPHVTQRMGRHFTAIKHNIVCLDIDNIEAPAGVDPVSLVAVETVVQRLPAAFQKSDYVVQFSSSAGLQGRIVKVHLWFWLQEPQKDVDLKKWAKSTNGLVDHAVFSRVQKHLICDPTFEDPSQNPFKDRKRLYYIEKSRETVPVVFLENTPTPSNNLFGRGGGILRKTTTDRNPAITLDPEGKALDGREGLHLKIRYNRMHMGYRSFEKFCQDVWGDFCGRAELGPTSLSETDWDRELSNRKCLQDKDKLAGYLGGNVQIPLIYLDRKEAQLQLDTAVTEFFSGRKNSAIRATAGLGKSKAVRDAIQNQPRRHDLSIEYYIPTKRLAHECTPEFGPELDVRVYEGRSEENCQKIELVKLIGEFGGGITHKLCHKKGGEDCAYWGSCKWSTQNPDDKPAIRIMAHANLGLERPSHFPDPDFVIVDESCLSEFIVERNFPASQIWNLPASREVRGTAPKTSKFPDEKITFSDYSDLCGSGSILRDAIHRGYPILTILRENGYTKEDLLRSACVVKAYIPYLNIDPDMTEDKMKRNLQDGERRNLKALRLLEKFYWLLAQEIDLDRGNPNSIEFTGDSCILMYRQELPRLEGVPVLFIDADLEPEILKVIKADIQIENIDVRYNADVYKVTDRAFSKSELGLVDGDFDSKKVGDLKEFITSRKSPEKTLVVSYIELQKILTGERKGFSQMDCGATVAHFGNIRGFDSFKDFETVIIIGRHKPPTHVMGQKLRALTCDKEISDPSKLSAAIYRAMVTSETNQAVARLRMIWCDHPKTVYLLSNENVPFPAQHELTWDELKAGGSRLDLLVKAFGAFPLIGRWLFEHAGHLFSSKKAAEKWVENTFPCGTETGVFKVVGKGGPKPSRFYANHLELDPLKKLEGNLACEVSKYCGPEQGFWVNGELMRILTSGPEYQALLNMGIVRGPRLPEP